MHDNDGRGPLIPLRNPVPWSIFAVMSDKRIRADHEGGLGASDPDPLAHHRFFYLPPKLWSPRYESDFYSATVGGHQVFEAPPPPPMPPSLSEGLSMESPSMESTPRRAMMGGNAKHPAVYYQVTVRRARTTTVLWRRYSQFAWLRRQWADHPPPPLSLSSTPLASAPAESTKVSREAPGAVAPPAPFTSSAAAGGAAPEGFPSGCPFFWWALPDPHREAFLRQRADDLSAYLDRALGAPGYATHPATVAFLELR